MHYVPLDKLEPNMITAEPVVTKRGQIIVGKNTILTVQMITHMFYYGISQVRVLDDEISSAVLNSAYKKLTPVETYSQRVQRSPSFKEFKRKYTAKLNLIENSLNDIINRQKPVDKDALLSEVMDLFTTNTTISMFDMLHNMRKVNDSTYAHSINVSIISRMMGIWLNFSEEDLNILSLGGLLHDIGKCKIPLEILEKPAKLTDEEYEVIKRHPTIGYNLLKSQNLDTHIKLCALQHHERCSGNGYPLGLMRDDIDNFAAIVAIADVYDAMTSSRCYRNGLCPFEVIATFEQEGLNQYKPRFITTFLEHIANTYINNEVLLSDNTRGKIILINKQLTRPVIQTDENEFINLMDRPDLYVQAII